MSTKVDFTPPEKIIMKRRKADRNRVKVQRILKDPTRLNRSLKAVKGGTPETTPKIALAVRIRGYSLLTQGF